MPTWDKLPLIVFGLVAGFGTGMLIGLWRLGFFSSPKEAKKTIRRNIDGDFENLDDSKRSLPHMLSLVVCAIAVIFTSLYIQVGSIATPPIRFGLLLFIGSLYLIAEVSWKLGTFSWKEFFDPHELGKAVLMLIVFSIIFVASLIFPPAALALTVLTLCEMLIRGKKSLLN